MSYEAIVLELMGRIQTLENEMKQANAAILGLESRMKTGETEEDKYSPDRNETIEKSAVSYGRINEEMMLACYEAGKRLYQNPRLDISKLASGVAQSTAMNRNSAFMFIYVVDCMLKGEVYKRAISMQAQRLCLGKIQVEFGDAQLRTALEAVRAHIVYREECGHTVDGVVAVLKDFERML